MTAERLLRLFDRVVDAPHAVPRLKQLVLNLYPFGRSFDGSQVRAGNASMLVVPRMWRASMVTPSAFVPEMLKL